MSIAIAAALSAMDLGWCLTPILNKVPVLKGWPTLPRPTEADVRAWDAQGYALGVRTGPASGVIVIDVDPGAPPEWLSPDKFPDAPCARTPRGGLHFYFFCTDPPVRNSASKLAPHVDVRGAGGQVAMPGVPGREWIRPPNGSLPAWPFPVASKPPRKAAPARVAMTPSGSKWADAALLKELEALSATGEGARNNALNIAAFNLGQLVGGGELDEGLVVDNLQAIALGIGLPIEEIVGTLRSGLEAGKAKPRARPPPPEPCEISEEDEEPQAPAAEPAATAAAPKPATKVKPKIPVPGEHASREPGGSPVMVPAPSFTNAVLRAIEPGTIYRRMGVVGVVNGTAFEVISPNEMRLVIDRFVHLTERPIPPGNASPRDKYVSCSVDLASLVLAAAKTHKNVRELKILSPHPLITRERKALLHGWHEEHGALVVCDVDYTAVEPLPLWEPLIDFPFADAASRATVLAMFLSPLFRPLLNGHSPLFMLTAPTERSGKSKIVEDILSVILNLDIGMVTWTDDEEEIRKRVLAMVLSGKSVICIDNIPSTFESHALASLLTSRNISDRLLGQSTFITAPNRLTIIATGNNTEASSEIAKRALISRLEPGTETPEMREDFKYPDILAFVIENKDRIMRWLIDVGTNGPLGDCPPMGGFERWIGSVGRVVCGQGLPLATGATLPTKANDNLGPLYAAWWAAYGEGEVGAADLIPTAEGIEWGGNALDPTKSERSRATWLGNKLAANVGRVHGSLRLERVVSGRNTRYRLKSLQKEP